MPSVASEASAVAWNADTGTLFVLGDEGDALVEVSTTGSLISTMTLTGFDDTEGLTYIGNGQFVLTEERLQDAYRLTYSASGSVSRASLSSVSLGDTVGNVGIEGISYDPLSDTFITVKEKTPQEANESTLDFALGTATSSSLFTPNLGVSDLSDVQVLSGVATAESLDLDNLLIISQESSRLMEVDRSGTVLSWFDLASTTAEGVTIDSNGVIYVVDEEGGAGNGPSLYVLTPAPVPVPAAGWLMLSGLAGLASFVRRARKSNGS